MKQYEFHSVLPPEELKKELDRWVRVENILLDGKGKLKAKWRGMRLTLSRWDGGSSQGTDVSMKPFSASFSAGVSYEWTAANPFTGEVCEDGAGGSVLRGKIVLHFGAWILLGGFAAIIFLANVFSNTSPFRLDHLLLSELFVMLPIAFIILRDYRNVLPGSREILKFLDRTFEKLEGE